LETDQPIDFPDIVIFIKLISFSTQVKGLINETGDENCKNLTTLTHGLKNLTILTSNICPPCHLSYSKLGKTNNCSLAL